MHRKAFLGRLGATLLAGTGARGLLQHSRFRRGVSEPAPELEGETLRSVFGAETVVGAGPEGVAEPKSPLLLKPPRLKEGDTIGITAPAGVIYDPSEFERMERVMDDLGLKVTFGHFVRNRYGYLAGSDQQRLEDLHDLFKNPDINGILAARGGWGSNRLLPALDFDLIRANPKFFCGFSDITSLHLAISHKTGLVTFHGPNGTSDWSLFTRDHFRRTAFGYDGQMLLKNPPVEATRVQTIYPGSASGRLIGGNLTLVTSLLGTPYMPDMEGAILFLEDIGEAVYKVDRMFSELLLSGVLNQVRGVVFGKCSDCSRGVRGGFSLKEVLAHYLEPLALPSFYGSMISHEANIFTIPVGIRAEMDADAGTIRLLESPVV